jgi:hypothetical protein
VPRVLIELKSVESRITTTFEPEPVAIFEAYLPEDLEMGTYVEGCELALVAWTITTSLAAGAPYVGALCLFGGSAEAGPHSPQVATGMTDTGDFRPCQSRISGPST